MIGHEQREINTFARTNELILRLFSHVFRSLFWFLFGTPFSYELQLVYDSWQGVADFSCWQINYYYSKMMIRSSIRNYVHTENGKIAFAVQLFAHLCRFYRDDLNRTLFLCCNRIRKGTRLQYSQKWIVLLYGSFLHPHQITDGCWLKNWINTRRSCWRWTMKRTKIWDLFIILLPQ